MFLIKALTWLHVFLSSLFSFVDLRSISLRIQSFHSKILSHGLFYRQFEMFKKKLKISADNIFIDDDKISSIDFCGLFFISTPRSRSRISKLLRWTTQMRFYLKKFTTEKILSTHADEWAIKSSLSWNTIDGKMSCY